jgi:hypothetical protein
LEIRNERKRKCKGKEEKVNKHIDGEECGIGTKRK